MKHIFKPDAKVIAYLGFGKHGPGVYTVRHSQNARTKAIYDSIKLHATVHQYHNITDYVSVYHYNDNGLATPCWGLKHTAKLVEDE